MYRLPEVANRTSSVTGLITGDECPSIPRHFYGKQKHFYVKDVKNTIVTYKTLLQEQDHELRVRAYMRRLHEQRKYRVVVCTQHFLLPFLQWNRLTV